MGKSFAAALLATLLVIAACGGDDDDGTTGEGDGSTATEPTSPSTATGSTSSSTEPTTSSTEPTSSSTTTGTTSPTPTLSRFETIQASVGVPDPPGDPNTTEPAQPVNVDLNTSVGDQGCLYRKQLLVTAGHFDITVDGEPLNEITDASSVDMPIGADPQLLNSRGLYLYDTGGFDPLDVAFSLQKQSGVLASPVLLVTPSAHWILAPGAASQDTLLELAQLSSADPDGPLVAVVDTGYEQSVESWFGDSVQPALASEDADGAAGTDFGGHAMFIASVIRQFNPDSRVRIAGMPNLLANGDMAEFDRLFASHGGEGTPPLTNPMYVADELELIAGIDRLLRASDDPELLNEDPTASPLNYAVLNVSGGTYECSALTQSALTTWTALKYWYDKTEGTPVVAAAGNHDPTSPVTQNPSVPLFVPGQFGSGVVLINGAPYPLHGVQSVSGDSSGPLSRFSNEGAYKEVGEDLCGIRLDPTLGTLWGGSSFATAVASAKFTTPAGANGLTKASDPADRPFDDLPDQLRLRLGSCSPQG